MSVLIHLFCCLDDIEHADHVGIVADVQDVRLGVWLLPCVLCELFILEGHGGLRSSGRS